MDKLHIEIITTNNTIPGEDLIIVCSHYLASNHVQPGSRLTIPHTTDSVSVAGVKELVVNECNGITGVVDFHSKLIKWHIYSLNMLGPQAESINDSNGDYVNLATDYILPSSDLHMLWENLIYDDNVKEDLLDYAQAVMSFSQRGVNFNIINCNRVILLHGPPGTGKTSLCTALAQKLSIRMMKTYSNSILIEVNSHNLFSKWFSESGKLVTKMFDHIRDVCALSNTLVCVLIDEVESLAHAREQCLNGNEPSDAVKVVNAVLTQIDNLKRYPNVLVLTTSNIMRFIDVAFVDRADFKQYIGPPNVRAIKKIYRTCVDELIRADVIYQDAETSNNVNSKEFDTDLDRISRLSLGLSGRMLRKLPLLACVSNLHNQQIGLRDFVNAMSASVGKEFEERSKLINGKSNEKFTNGC